jgi:hypothetical protein
MTTKYPLELKTNNLTLVPLSDRDLADLIQEWKQLSGRQQDPEAVPLTGGQGGRNGEVKERSALLVPERLHGPAAVREPMITIHRIPAVENESLPLKIPELQPVG